MICERRLDNGLVLLTESMPDLRSATVGVWLRRGSRHEPGPINGISHFIEHLVFKGTERRTAADIAREIDAVGGQMDAFTSKESTCFYIRVLDLHLPLALDMLTDILRHPRFDADAIEKERKVIFEEIRMVEDSPEELLIDLLYTARWGDHPLGRPIQGTFDTVGPMDRDLLGKFFTSTYTPSNLVLSAAGHLDPEAIAAHVDGVFADLPAGSSEEPIAAPISRAGIVSRPKNEMEQLHLCLAVDGLPQTDDDRYALLVLNNLLGGTMSSRLFQKVREERGLAYSVYSGVNAHADSGFQVIYAATNPTSARDVMKVVGEELQRLKEEAVAEAELADSRENLKGNLMLSMESSSSRMSNLARKEIVHGRQFTMEEILAGIDAVTVDDMQRLARATFRAEGATLAVLGPLDGFDPDESLLDF
ncbi:MAG: M16 family metallopeptidase [Acidobacteriota bacterium]